MAKVPKLPPPKHNEAYVCQWADGSDYADGNWYRAQVRNVTNEKVTIVFVDFGNETTILRKDWGEKARSLGGFLTERPMCSLPMWDGAFDDVQDLEGIQVFLDEHAESKFTFVPELAYGGKYTDETASGKLLIDGVP